VQAERFDLVRLYGAEASEQSMLRRGRRARVKTDGQ
jgi:hypothetical protein